MADADAQAASESKSPTDGSPMEKHKDVTQETDMKHFKYWAWTFSKIEVREFDATEEACKPFGWYHGQRVKHTKGNNEGQCSTIIGVREGSLWYDVDGQVHGAVCNPALNLKVHDDFKNEFGWKALGKVSVEPATDDEQSPRGCSPAHWSPEASPTAAA
ncbi:putative E3 ubiquitin-protein ligase HERC2 [Diplonema papillatum]|nr:putative E3 ubiquitin-protein ligase HERC2 [Diplonema papillatum]